MNELSPTVLASEFHVLTGPADIAIVGGAVRLPGNVNSLDALWTFLLGKGDGIRDVPEGRWLSDLYDPAGRPGRTYVRKAGFIDGLDLIDTTFLNCAPREAGVMDPQHRLLVETAFEALENAGIPLETIRRSRTGVFVGISSNDFGQLQNEDPLFGNAYSNTGSAFSIAANRISYVFDLRGPSLAIDTACSSGLTALDFAVRAIRQGSCEQAIVGAANVLLKPEIFAGFCAAKMLSPAAQCRAFDAGGAGFVRAEGAVTFVLKPLGAAERDNDPILSVIKGSDTNNDGRTGGLSLPNPDAQAELIERVLKQHDLPVDDIVYVEAHGTGTAAGDPIEASSIGRAIAQQRKSADPLPIGSIKANVGHLEPASGLAGLAKAVMCLQNGVIPPSLHFDTPNPAIEFDKLRITVQTEATPFAPTGGPPMIAINSFGFGGANAHAVVAKAPERVREPSPMLERPWFMVSGRSPEAMRQAAASLSAHLKRAEPKPDLYDLSGTLLTRRSWHPHRTALWADSINELRAALDAVAADERSAAAVTNTALPAQKPVFVFTGNGPQWWGMGRELLAQSPIFRDAVEEIDAAFRSVADFRLIDEMTADEASSRMHLTEIAQPALFAVQIGITRCLAGDGLTPGAAIGHSAGELAATYCAGLFDLETIVRIIHARSFHQGKTAGTGAMAAIGYGAEEAADLIASCAELVITGDNGPCATTIAGSVDAIDQQVAEINAAGGFARKLPLNYAFHSPAMDPIETGFRTDVEGVRGRTGTIPFYSTVTGAPLDGAEADADYWWRNLRDPVQFRTAIDTLQEDGHGLFVEIGPHPNLVGYVRAQGDATGKSVRTVETLRRGEPEAVMMRKALAGAGAAGAAFDFSERFPVPVEVLRLPNYPWQRERYFTVPEGRTALWGTPTGHRFLGDRVSAAKRAWVQNLAVSTEPFIADHVVRDAVLFPGSAFFETALAAGIELYPGDVIELREVQIRKPLVLEEAREVSLQTFLDADDHAITISSRVRSRDGDSEPEHFVEHVRAVVEHRPFQERKVDLDTIRAPLDRVRSCEEHYRFTAQRGLNYKTGFTVIDCLETGNGEVLATITRQDEAGGRYHLDPAQVDGALQAMMGLIDATDDHRLFLPVRLDRLVFRASTREHRTVKAHVVARRSNRFFMSADITIVTSDGTVLAELHGMEVRAVGTSAGSDAAIVHHVLKPAYAFDPAVPEIDPARLLDGYRESSASILRRKILVDHDRRLSEMSSYFTAATFRALSGGEHFSIAELVESGTLAERHVRYAQTMLGHAIRQGLVTEDGGVFQVISDPDALAVWREYMSDYPQYSAEWHCTARMWLHHEALLRGDMEPLEILFPRSGSRTMEQIYEQGFSTGEANALLAEAVRQFSLGMPETRPVRILEIGGGTGGTTAHVLNAAPADRIDYVFTDISPDFLGDAERRFRDVPSFSTAVLNLNAPSDLDALGGPFDVILGANVVHATPSVRRTIGAARDMLRENGLLAIIELERVNYFDFLFGLLPGVWLFEDLEDRSDHALLPGESWTRILGEEGFDQVALRNDATERNDATFSVLLARKGPAEAESEARSAATASQPEGEAEQQPSWMIMAPVDEAGMASDLAGRIQASGQSVLTIHTTRGAGAAAATDGESMRTIPAQDDDAWADLCRGLKGAEPHEIVVFAPRAGLGSVPDTDGGWPLVALVKAADAAGWSRSPRLSIVTENLLDDAGPNLAAGAFWAVGRAITNELPRWKCRRIDCDASPEAHERLLGWLTGAGQPAIGETTDELRITADSVLVNYLKPLQPAPAEERLNDRPKPFAVTLSAQGSVDNLVLKEVQPADGVEPGAVEVAMKAAGLNFKDLMLVLGMLPPELLKDSAVGPLFGLEGAGDVVRVGEGVEHVVPGDRVMLMGEGCFASSVVIPAQAVQKIPKEWSYQEAATLPVVGLTVVYALDIMARLQPGETLLVHGGAGGIGLLAIQYAKSVGAKVIATAGSAEKRDLLRALGVDCISDSRTLRFDEDTRAFTGGEGVDVVLNSLAGDAMLASLDLMKPFGRFVEIGKRDFEANNRLNLKALERNISYHAVDLTYLPQQRSEVFLKAWQHLLDAFHSGAIRPLPFRTYTLAHLKEAFRLMQAGRHIGKLLIDLESVDAVPEPLPASPMAFASEGVHLIAGGLGGIGLKLAQWMAGRGARTIALLGRKGVITDAQARAIKAIEAAGATVIVEKADVSDAGRIEILVADLVRDHGPIRGIVHSVLVLDDNLMANMTREAFERAARPKVDGAYNLHTATRNQPIDYFVAFSSLANVLGSPGQSNYVAANAYLEQLMAGRRAQGLPGLALALGPVADAGILERDESVRAGLSAALGSSISVADILAALDRLLAGGPAVAIIANPKGKLSLPIMATARLGLMAAGEDTSAAAAEQVDFAAVPSEERQALMESVLIETIAWITGAKENRIDPEHTLSDTGLDSLMTMEFGHGIEQRLGVSISTSELAQDRSIRDLGLALLAWLNLEVATPAHGASEGGDGDAEIGESPFLTDAVLPDGLVYGHLVSPKPLAEANAVFVTGATGFLGAFMVDELLSRGASRVVCLVRARDDGHACERLENVLRKAGLAAAQQELGKRLEVWCGDFGQEGMSLPVHRQIALRDDIDVILHNGADVSFVGTYPAMKSANVDSLLRFFDIVRSAPGKALHYVSTLRIFTNPEQVSSNAPISEETVPLPPTGSEGGYVTTKWVSDMLAHRARENGFPVGIYRPSFVIGSTRDGYSNVSDLATAIGRLARDVGIFPDIDLPLIIVPVDVAARRIVAFMDQPGEQFGTRHITDWPATSLRELHAEIVRSGLQADLVPMDEFLERVGRFFRENPKHPSLWLQYFLTETTTQNRLGELLTEPVLPSGAHDVSDLESACASIPKMARWL